MNECPPEIEKYYTMEVCDALHSVNNGIFLLKLIIKGRGSYLFKDKYGKFLYPFFTLNVYEDILFLKEKYNNNCFVCYVDDVSESRLKYDFRSKSLRYLYNVTRQEYVGKDYDT